MGNNNWLNRTSALNINCERCNFTRETGCGCGCGNGFTGQSLLSRCGCNDCDCDNDNDFGTTAFDINNGTAWTSNRCCNTFNNGRNRSGNRNRDNDCGCGCDNDCGCGCNR